MPLHILFSLNFLTTKLVKIFVHILNMKKIMEALDNLSNVS